MADGQITEPLTLFPEVGEKPLDVLRAQVKAQLEEDKKHSYLGGVVGYLTEFVHGSRQSLNEMQDIERKLDGKGFKFDDRLSEELVRRTVKANKQALSLRNESVFYGSSMLKTGALFFPGSRGLLASAAFGAADSAKQEDAWLTQVGDSVLGAAKGTLTKLAMDKLSRTDFSLAAKAVSIGALTRTTEASLSRSTYLDKSTGDYDFGLGLGRTWQQATDWKAAASDVLIFGIGHKLVGNLNATTNGALRENHLYGTVATGGIYGLASGSWQEILRQREAGESFDPLKVFGRSMARGLADGIAAIPGGMKLRSVQLDANPVFGREFQLKSPQPVVETLLSNPGQPLVLRVQELTKGVLGPEQSLLIQHLGRGDASKGPKPDLLRSADLLACCNADALVSSAQRLHLFPKSKGTIFLAQSPGASILRLAPDPAMLRGLFSKAEPNPAIVGLGKVPDFAAPGALPDFLLRPVSRSEPKGEGSLDQRIVSKNGVEPESLQGPKRTGAQDVPVSERFGSERSVPEKSGSERSGQERSGQERSGLDFGTEGMSRSSGSVRTVSDVLKDAPARVRELHDVDAIARALGFISLPAKRFLGGGADSLAVALADGRVLKVFDPYMRPDDPGAAYLNRSFSKDWGRRTVRGADGDYVIDAQILAKPRQVKVGDSQVTIFVQEKVRTPVAAEDLRSFEKMIEADGRLKFWDNGTNGPGQVGYVIRNGEKRVVLIDYDAVRPKDQVPRQERQEPPPITD